MRQSGSRMLHRRAHGSLCCRSCSIRAIVSRCGTWSSRRTFRGIRPDGCRTWRGAMASISRARFSNEERTVLSTTRRCLSVRRAASGSSARCTSGMRRAADSQRARRSVSVGCRLRRSGFSSAMRLAFPRWRGFRRSRGRMYCSTPRRLDGRATTSGILRRGVGHLRTACMSWRATAADRSRTPRSPG